MIGLSWVLGEKHKEKTTDEPYESGIPPNRGCRDFDFLPVFIS